MCRSAYDQEIILKRETKAAISSKLSRHKAALVALRSLKTGLVDGQAGRHCNMPCNISIALLGGLSATLRGAPGGIALHGSMTFSQVLWTRLLGDKQASPRT